ncbi:MAG: YkvA family protein [Bacteroidales bacterium]
MSFSRKYRGVSTLSILIWIFCIAYFVSPIDAVFDAVPIFGFIDDAAVLGWGIARFNKEFKKFKEWDADSCKEQIKEQDTKNLN